MQSMDSWIYGFMFGAQPLIKILLRGMFKERPKLLCYTVIYDARHILHNVKNWYNSSETSLE